MAYVVQGKDVVTIKVDEKPPNIPFAYTLPAELEQAKAQHAASVWLGQPFEDVENLLWIKSNTVYKEALEDWERQTKSLGDRLERREKRSEELTNQIYNLVGFFSVFQGVLLTAVTQLTQSTPSSRPLCGKVWFPFTLSLLAAIAASVGIGLKFSQLHTTDKLIFTDKLDQKVTIARGRDLREKGGNFKFQDLQDREKKPLKSYWCIKATVVIGGVLSFTVIFILSYYVILCDKFVF